MHGLPLTMPVLELPANLCRLLPCLNGLRQVMLLEILCPRLDIGVAQAVQGARLQLPVLQQAAELPGLQGRLQGILSLLAPEARHRQLRDAEKHGSLAPLVPPRSKGLEFGGGQTQALLALLLQQVNTNKNTQCICHAGVVGQLPEDRQRLRCGVASLLGLFRFQVDLCGREEHRCVSYPFLKTPVPGQGLILRHELISSGWRRFCRHGPRAHGA
mmetsp:Transcript_15282/g.32168  ORF Transcript_15282/g.32168 Transcript_15282/m.32168 type:complete len:215 (-) Transcript_15282:32-676(-)